MTSLVGLSGSSIVRLTLNRPEARNALTVASCDAIVEALTEVDRSQDARVVVVGGEGKVFCSGADLAAVSGPGGVDFLPAFERMLEAVAAFRLPTIAAIQGAALGGGLQLATVCDFRIASSDAKLGIPSSRLGIVINFENVQRLVLLVGTAGAKEILMTARSFSGEEAERRRLVDRAVPADMLESEVASLAQEVASLAPLSVQGAKKAIAVVTRALSDARSTDPDAVRAIDELVMQAYGSADLREGIAAMTDKRVPRFEGR